MDGTESFILSLVVKYDFLKSIYKEHIKDYDELLPHVFMGDLTRKVMYLDSLIRSNKDSSAVVLVLKDLMSDLENGLNTGSDEIKELINVSFIENLSDYEYREHIKIYFGKALLNEYKKVF